LVDSAIRTNGWKQLSGKKGVGLAGGFLATASLVQIHLDALSTAATSDYENLNGFLRELNGLGLGFKTLLAAVVRMESI
jgi:hypothetical protein